MQTTAQSPTGFSSLGLPDRVLFTATRAGFTNPTPIQEQAIPIALQGHDLIGIAQTGTGKTLAFALPIISRLLECPTERALVLVPTRELALQVEESIRALTGLLPVSMRTVCLIGGTPIFRQIKALGSHPRIIVATPGRLNDHLQQKTVRLDQVGVLVLDEADRMLDMGFAPQIKSICDTITGPHQTMLFSATMAPEIERLSSNYLTSPRKVEIATAGRVQELVQQEICYVEAPSKTDLLARLLSEHSGTVLVFARTKHGTSKLARKISDLGHTAAEIHSNRSLGQRRQALDGFKSGRYRVLVATDVASRGIDVKDISLVINFDLPDATEDYVHRIGRTGRAGKDGRAISFATPDQHRDVQAIERLTGQSLPLSSLSQARPQNSSYNSSRSSFNRGRTPSRFGAPRRSSNRSASGQRGWSRF